MKQILLIFSILFYFPVFSQTLPIDFEENITTSDFEDFDGGTATVLENPQKTGINTSSTVARLVRDGGAEWSGSKIKLDSKLDFETLNSITMKVYTSAPIGTVIKLKLEGEGETERDRATTVTQEWETITWDFTGEPMNFDYLVFMFDFGNVGDGSGNSTFLFDDVEQLFGGSQIDLPVDFEDDQVNYTMTDFGGNASSLINDPTIGGNKVIQVIKTDEAATWAGTTIGTPGGFKTNIPLTLSDSKMSVKVWSPEAGTPIRLKVEDSNDPTHTCETETNSTLDGGWEIITFDFTNQAPGTAELSFGLSNGWTYNMASIFFNFGTEGAQAGEKTYYFDDVKFGEQILSTYELEDLNLSVFPNPASHYISISSLEDPILNVKIYDTQGRLIKEFNPNANKALLTINSFQKGIYWAQVRTKKGTQGMKVMKID